jgi:hypothetical protein
VPEVVAYLTDLREELDPRVPFFGAQAGFETECVEVCDNAFEEVAQARIGALAVY